MDADLAREFAALTLEAQDELLEGLPAPVVKALLNAREQEPDQLQPLLPHQVPPDDDWSGWVLLAGRGTGKTLAGARWIHDLAVKVPGLRARVISPTLSDAVNGVLLDPQSGIRRLAPQDWSFRGSGPEGTRLVHSNGSTVWAVGTPTLRDVDRLRALTNVDADMYDEAAANPMLTDVVEQAALSRRGLRLERPRWIATTTPRPVPVVRKWAQEALDRASGVRMTRASTLDNPYTPEAYRAHTELLRGTRLYRQEVLGEILEDVEGALWTLANLERSIVPRDLSPIIRVSIGVDPAATTGTTGIVAAGLSAEGHLYVLSDHSVTAGTPDEWARAVVGAYDRYAEYMPTIVAENNQGGNMVESTIRHVRAGLPITVVNARLAKDQRAGPIAGLWEPETQVAHLMPDAPGALDLLVNEMTEWAPNLGMASPDRIDALVWAGLHLKPGGLAEPRVSASRPMALPTL